MDRNIEVSDVRVLNKLQDTISSTLRVTPMNFIGAFAILGIISTAYDLGLWLSRILSAWSWLVDTAFAYSIDPILSMIGVSIPLFLKHYIVLSGVIAGGLARSGFYFGILPIRSRYFYRHLLYGPQIAPNKSPLQPRLRCKVEAFIVFFILLPIFIPRFVKMFRFHRKVIDEANAKANPYPIYYNGVLVDGATNSRVFVDQMREALSALFLALLILMFVRGLEALITA